MDEHGRTGRPAARWFTRSKSGAGTILTRTPFVVAAAQELLPYRERPEHIPTCQHILEHSQVRRISSLTRREFVTEFLALCDCGYCALLFSVRRLGSHP